MYEIFFQSFLRSDIRLHFIFTKHISHWNSEGKKMFAAYTISPWDLVMHSEKQILVSIRTEREWQIVFDIHPFGITISSKNVTPSIIIVELLFVLFPPNYRSNEGWWWWLWQRYVPVYLLYFKWQKDRKYSLAQYNNGTIVWSVDSGYAINFNVIYLSKAQ